MRGFYQLAVMFTHASMIVVTRVAIPTEISVHMVPSLVHAALALAVWCVSLWGPQSVCVMHCTLSMELLTMALTPEQVYVAAQSTCGTSHTCIQIAAKFAVAFQKRNCHVLLILCVKDCCRTCPMKFREISQKFAKKFARKKQSLPHKLLWDLISFFSS